jgi:hypothetical protein
MTNRPWPVPITAAQCRAARGLLHWTQDKLGFEASISASTVRSFEYNLHPPHPNNLSAMMRAMEAHGVIFTKWGVELVKPEPAGKEEPLE